MEFEATSPQSSQLIRLHDRLVLIVSCWLCVTAQLKIFEIQLLELFFMVDFALVAAWVLLKGEPIQVAKTVATIAMRWSLFALAALLLAVLALRQDFFLEKVTVFKQPLVVTVSRIVELFVDVFYMLFIAERLRQDYALRKFAAKAYLYAGVAGAVYALLSVAAMAAFGRQLLRGIDRGWRLVGFNNEGGPYGLYLVTMFFVLLLIRAQGWLSRRMFYLLFGVFLLTLLGTRSKAALFEVALLALITPFLRMRGLKRAATVLVIALALVGVWVALDVPKLIGPYLSAADTYQAQSALQPENANLVMGRAAGVYLAPKMIAEHPLAGIGLGNYPIVRDDPKYRHGTPIVATTLDGPALGPIDYIVDLGFPLFFYLTWIELAPALELVRSGASFPVVSLVLMQPISNWFGAHLNLTYPWVVAGIALGFYLANTAPGTSRNLSATALG